ncbi:MAG: hypothetical protein ACRD4Q_10930 [Candidatus Acidiferrales bacterium]
MKNAFQRYMALTSSSRATMRGSLPFNLLGCGKTPGPVVTIRFPFGYMGYSGSLRDGEIAPRPPAMDEPIRGGDVRGVRECFTVVRHATQKLSFGMGSVLNG